MSLLDPISPDDMKALGDALGNAVGQHVRAAVQNAIADTLERYESVTFQVTIKLNLKA